MHNQKKNICIINRLEKKIFKLKNGVSTIKGVLRLYYYILFARKNNL